MTNTTFIFGESVVLPKDDGSLKITHALLKIEEGRILDVTPCKRTEIPSNIQYEDLGAQLVTPAFVNAHTHLCMLGYRGIGGLASLKGNVVEELYFKIEDSVTPGDVEAFTRIGALEALMSGTAFVWDHYYHASSLVKALTEVGLCAAIAPTLQDISGPGVQMLDLAWENTFEIAESKALKQKGIFAALGPHATDTVSDVLWNRVREAASVWNLPVHSHIAQSIQEVERSFENHQCGPMTRMQRLGLCEGPASRLWVHGLWVSNEELNNLTPLDCLIHCPSAQMQFDFPAPTQPWLDRNLKVLLGTDAPSCNDAINVQSELRFFGGASSYQITTDPLHETYRKSGLLEDALRVREQRQANWVQNTEGRTPETLLSSVWGNAKTLHPEAKVGVIEKGALANICVWDSEHPALWPNSNPLHSLCFNNTQAALNRIMICGEWKIDGAGDLNGRIMRDPRTREWLAEATAKREELMTRAGLTP